MKNVSRIWVFFTCFFLLCMNTTAFANNSTVSDSMITAKVKAQLAANKVTSATSINVETNQGVVTLSGAVGSNTEASTAVEIAGSTNGVKDVNTDNLTIKDSNQPMQDSYITAKVKGMFVREKLLNNVNMPVTPIKVETQNGTVYLSGEVKNDAQAKRAVELAQSVKGVNQVVSNLKARGA